MIVCSWPAGRQPPDHHLHRAADAGERIADFVGDDRRHLAELRERGLFAQRRFGAPQRALRLDPGGRALAIARHDERRQPERDGEHARG